MQPRDRTQVVCILGEGILYQLSHQESPRILEWVAYSFSRGSFWSKNWTGVSCISGRFFIREIWFDVFSCSFPHFFVLLVFWIYVFIIPFFSSFLFSSNWDSNCMYFRLLEIAPQLINSGFFFFFLVHTHSFIVGSFDCNVFEFTNYFLLQCVFSHNTSSIDFLSDIVFSCLGVWFVPIFLKLSMPLLHIFNLSSRFLNLQTATKITFFFY